MAQDPKAIASNHVNIQDSQISATPVVVSREFLEEDNQWEKTFQDVCSKLPAKDKEWLLKSQNQKCFTSTQIFEDIKPWVQKYTQHGFQKFIVAIEPVLSHINSFTGIINTFIQSHPEISGLIWGVLHLLITVSVL